MKQISQTADTWISEEEIPVSPALKIIRTNDPWHGMSDEEVEDVKEFIRCHLLGLQFLISRPLHPASVSALPGHQLRR